MVSLQCTVLQNWMRHTRVLCYLLSNCFVSRQRDGKKADSCVCWCHCYCRMCFCVSYWKFVVPFPVQTTWRNEDADRQWGKVRTCLSISCNNCPFNRSYISVTFNNLSYIRSNILDQNTSSAFEGYHSKWFSTSSNPSNEYNKFSFFRNCYFDEFNVSSDPFTDLYNSAFFGSCFSNEFNDPSIFRRHFQN